MRWKDFDAAQPTLAAAGRRLLKGDGESAVGILATVDAQGHPHVSPVRPVFTDTGVYLSVATHTPKRRHLDASGRFALHARPRANDEEFQCSGSARRVDAPNEFQAVLDAIPFARFDAAHPIYELLIDHAVHVTWPEPGRAQRVRFNGASD